MNCEIQDIFDPFKDLGFQDRRVLSSQKRYVYRTIKFDNSSTFQYSKPKSTRVEL